MELVAFLAPCIVCIHYISINADDSADELSVKDKLLNLHL